MTKPNITPGPWRAKCHEGEYFVGHGNDLPSALFLMNSVSNQKEDAKAIAAVPDLLAALEKALESLEAIHDHGFPGITNNDAQDAESGAKAALIKAGYTF